MKAIRIQDIIQCVGASAIHPVDQDVQVESVEFDSRKVTPGALFVPLVGGNTDGHDYVQQAIDQGAVACFWSANPDQAPVDQIQVIFVKDTLRAMQDLAHYYRQLIDPIVIGITGSNGKTTAKDMTAMSLTSKYQVYKTQGNFNNEIGMPYTILSMPETTEVLVLEMGMNHFGEIQRLSEIAQPDYAAITLIGESHIEFLGSRQGIAQAKLEILAGMQQGGVLVYPGNEPLIDQALEKAPTAITCYRFGFDPADDFYAYDIHEEYNKTYFRTSIDGNVLSSIPIIGSYNVSNALIALTFAQFLQVPIEQAIFQLSQFELTANRVQWLKTHNGAKLLNDAYNASPTSMRAILHSLGHVEVEGGGRKIAVLGDILELGEHSAAYHRGLAEELDPERIEAVYLFGPEMVNLYEVLKEQYPENRLFYERDNHQTLIQALQRAIKPEDVILVKSSFGVDLLQVVTALTQA